MDTIRLRWGRGAASPGSVATNEGRQRARLLMDIASLGLRQAMSIERHRVMHVGSN